MTMTKTIGAGEFKAKCLELIDTVARTGTDLVITKRGKAIARLAPLAVKRPKKSLRGSIVADDDLVSPLGLPWEAAE